MSTPNDFSAAAQSLVAALLAAIVDPADGIRLLSSLASFQASGISDTSPIGKSMAAMQTATASLFRRAAVVTLARASSTYKPSSYDDAANVRTTVCTLLDNEILIAGDNGEDATYSALSALRSAVSRDLTTRGANLARVTTFKFNAAMPSLTLANRLYQDSTRSDELITQANPRHPAFMPIRFKALSV